MEDIIIVKELTKSFGNELVLRSVSCSFKKGEIHGIVGNNGSGKTVLMKCICGFLRPDSGCVLVDGSEIGRDCDFPNNLGVIIETPGFLPQKSGFQNLNLLAMLNGRASVNMIRYAMQLVDLDPDSRKPVGKYSLGMRQRLGLAQALMEDPDVLILDEPLNGLDKLGVIHVRNIIRQLRNSGKTILLASHNQVDIDELCDTVIEMDGGSITRVR